MLRIVKAQLILFSFLLFPGILSAYPPYFKSEIRKEFFERNMSDRSLTPFQRLAWADSMTTVSADTTPEQLLDKGMLYEEAWRNIDAYSHYMRALQMADPDSLRLRAILTYRCASATYHANIYAEAVRFARKVLQTPKPDSLLWLDVECNTILAALSATFGQHGRMSEYVGNAEKSLERLDRSGASDFRRTTSRQTYEIIHSALLNAKGDTVGTFRSLREARERITDQRTLALIENNMGLIYSHAGELEMAERCYLNAISIPAPLCMGRIAAVINYVSTLIRQGRRDEAVAAMEQYSRELAMTAGGEFEIQVHLLHYQLACMDGDLDKALTEVERAWALRDSMQSVANSIALEEFGDAGSDDELRYGDPGVMSIAMFAAVLVLLAAVVWLYVRLRRMGFEADGRVAAAVASGDDLSEENAELIMKLDAVSEAIGPLMQMSERATADDHAIASAAREAVRSIKVKQKVWEERPDPHGGANRRFFDRLHRLNAGLTNAELRMCGYALMNLAPKDIASLTNRSVKTVNSIRHNLRKKLSIEPDETTEAFMRRVSSATPDELRALADRCAGRR